MDKEKAIYQPHTSAGAENPPSFSQITAPAPSCCCGIVVGTSSGYIDDEGEEHDMEVYYRRCELHERDSQSTWLIDTLAELRNIRGELTPAGIGFMNELRRESDKANPYIPELERVKGRLAKIDEFLSRCAHAREKEAEWNQQYNVSLSKTGTGIPYPDWLKKYSKKNQKAMEARRDELFNQKLEIQQKIVNWRYKI